MCVLPAAPMHCAAAVEYDTKALETACSTLAPGATSHTTSLAYETCCGVYHFLFA